jgi:Amidase
MLIIAYELYFPYRRFSGKQHTEKRLSTPYAAKKRATHMEKITFASATTLARAIREQQVSPQEVVDAYLARIAAINPALNAAVQLRAEAARAEARTMDRCMACLSPSRIPLRGGDDLHLRHDRKLPTAPAIYSVPAF